MYDVICIGSATQDVFVSSDQTCLISVRTCDNEETYLAYEYGAKVAVDHLFITTGGGAANTAISFARLGLRTGIICEVGEDDAGRMIEGALRAEDVDTTMMTRNPDLTTGYSVILTGPTGDRTVLVHRGAATGLTRPEVDWESAAQTTWLYLSSLAGESASLWDDLATFACEHGLRLAINPGGQQIKRGLDGLRGILSVTDLLFLNQREAYQLLDLEEKRGEDDEREALSRLVAAGCKCAIMTRGAEGAMAFDGTDYHLVPAPPVPVVSNLGAGDAFASGCLAALCHGLPLANALKVATLNSGSVVGYMGATKGLLTWETVEAQLRQRPGDPDQ
ncbi:MAG: carbohydrate kinase family protein [Armatimonadota bacterium]